MGLAWHAPAGELFEGCESLLVVSAKSLTAVGATHREDLAAVKALVDRPYGGIVWRVQSELEPGLTLLRSLLSPGAALLLVVEARRPEALLRSLLGKPAWPPYVLEDVCEALVLKGLSEPRLVAESRAGFAAAASNPAQRSVLDVFFEQPPT